MKPLFLLFAVIILFTGCFENQDAGTEHLRELTLADIKREYVIADSLNRLADKSDVDMGTKILGVDRRNGQIIVRTCGPRGFGCYLFTNYFTLEYLDCDSLQCNDKGGIWLIDYVGIAGTPSVVGCIPDTL